MGPRWWPARARRRGCGARSRTRRRMRPASWSSTRSMPWRPSGECPGGDLASRGRGMVGAPLQRCLSGQGSCPPAATQASVLNITRFCSELCKTGPSLQYTVGVAYVQCRVMSMRELSGQPMTYLLCVSVTTSSIFSAQKPYCCPLQGRERIGGGAAGDGAPDVPAGRPERQRRAGGGSRNDQPHRSAGPGSAAAGQARRGGAGMEPPC